MVEYAKVKKGVIAFLDNEFLGKMPAGTIAKVATGVVIGILSERVDGLAKQYMQSPMLISLGIVNDKQEIDIDLLKKHLIGSMKNDKIEIDIPLLSKTIGSVKISKDDIESLYDYIMED